VGQFEINQSLWPPFSNAAKEAHVSRMPDRSRKRPRDPNQLAATLIAIRTVPKQRYRPSAELLFKIGRLKKY
jgi:hypothetical protein